MPPPRKRAKNISDPLVSKPKTSKRLRRNEPEEASEDSSPLKQEKGSDNECFELLDEIPEKDIKKQRERGRYSKYDKEDLIEAVQMVKTKKMSLNNAAKYYNVPKTTVLNYVTFGDREHQKRGTEPALKAEEEQQILSWLLDGSDMGIPRTKDDLLQAASDVLKLNNRSNVFRNGIPTHHWIKTFTNRHKNCARLRKPGTINEGKFFQTFNSFLEKNDYLSVLQRPNAFYILEDTNFELDPTKVSAERRMLLKKCLSRKSEEPSTYRLKNSVTVTYGFGADGRVLQQLLTFRESFKDMVKVAIADQKLNAKFLFTRTHDGGNTKDTFRCYLERIDAQLRDVERPIFLFCSETLPSVGVELSRWCNEKKIYVISFIPNSISVLQKIDEKIFKNNGWAEEIKNVQEQNGTEEFSEVDFIKALKNMNDRIIDEDKILESFAEAGIFPFDDTKISDSPTDLDTDDEDNSTDKKKSKILTKIQQLHELSNELSNQLKNKRRNDLVLNVKIITQQLDFIESAL